MKGIILISHGNMAKGLKDTAKFIMGDSLEQIDYCCLKHGESPESFKNRLEKIIKKNDSGDGVIIMADLFAGTPCNQTVPLLNEKVELIAGAGFPLLLELLTARMGEKKLQIDELVEISKVNIINVKKAISSIVTGEDDE